MAESYGAEKNIEHTIQNWKHLVKKKKKSFYLRSRAGCQYMSLIWVPYDVTITKSSANLEAQTVSRFVCDGKKQHA